MEAAGWTSDVARSKAQQFAVDRVRRVEESPGQTEVALRCGVGGIEMHMAIHLAREGKAEADWRSES